MSHRTPAARNLSVLRPSRRKLYVAMLAASQLMGVGKVLAAPEGGVVVGGSGSIDQSGLDTTIHQSTELMAIDWKSFDVNSDERVEFIQPNSTSVALNRIVSGKGSQIMGRIDANGQVLLINPNGVVFGKGSQINVGGILASGLSIDPAEFMNGEFTLTALEGTDGKVINSGIINAATGGSVTLIGQQVKNDGLISARLGAVTLAAGKEAVVTFDRSGMIGVKVTKEVLQKDLGIDAAVINSGDINAEGGRILITASVSQDIFSDAVNNGGMNQQSSVVVNEDGSFTLGAGSDVVNTGNITASAEVGDAGQVVVLGNNITSSGTISADAVKGSAGNIELHSTEITRLEQKAKVTATASAQGVGGDVKVLGDKVGLFDQAEVNVSGANGGGQVLIGGDQTGSNSQIRNANFIYLDENTSVKSDGLLNGDGGKLITFAQDTARIHGLLSVVGGSEGGNGGFIETSGLKGFEITKTPELGAAKGQGGTWLIDPFSIEIKAAGDATLPRTGDVFESSAQASILDVNVLEKVFPSGGGVTVIVKTGAGGTGSGDIKLSSELSYDFSGDTDSNKFNTLRFEADGDILINANIKRQKDNENKLNIEFHAGKNITFGRTGGQNSPGASIETKGGSFKSLSTNFDSSIGSIITSGDFNTGDVKILAKETVKLGSITAQDLTVLGDSNISLTDYIDPETITQAQPEHNIKPSHVEISQTGTSFLDISGTAYFDAGSGVEVGDPQAGNILLNNLNNDFKGKVIIASANNVALRDVNSISLGNFTIGGTLNLFSGGNISQSDFSDKITVVDSTSLSAVSAVNLSNTGNNFQSVSTAGASVGSLKISDIDALVFGSIAIDGNGDNVFSAKTITTTGVVAAERAGNLTFSAVNGITLGNNITSKGDITFNHAIASSALALSIEGKKLTFLGDIGASAQQVGDLTLQGTQEIAARNIAAKSVTVKGTKDLTALELHTQGKNNQAGGAVTISASGVVKVGDIDTRAGGNATNTGLAGGAIAINGNKISFTGINTSGSNGFTIPDQAGTPLPGGKAGSITIAASGAGASVTLGGDIKAFDGVASVGDAIQAQVQLDSAGTVNIYMPAFTSLVNIKGSAAGSGNDKLIGSSSSTTWSITGAGNGSIGGITFSGFEEIEGGEGNDTFNLNAADIGKINGGKGSDKFNILLPSSITGTLSGGENIGSQIDTLVAAIVAPGVVITNNWRLGGNDETLNNTLHFSGIGNITGTNESVDNFAFTGARSAAGTIVAGSSGIPSAVSDSVTVSGNAEIDFTGSKVLLNGVSDAEVFKGADGATLTAISSIGQKLNWVIDASNAGSVGTTGFSGFSTVTGGAGDDAFAIKNDAFVTGLIDGGAGVNSFSAADPSNTISYNLLINSSDTSKKNRIKNFASVTGNGQGATLSIEGASADINSWSITGVNSGQIDIDKASKETITFTQFSALQGGAGSDKFLIKTDATVNEIATIVGSITGGEGINSIDLSGITNLTKNLSFGAVGTFSFANIDEVKGGASDFLSFNAGNGNNIWVIDSANGGRVEVSPGEFIAFSSFKNIIGGTGTDSFEFQTAGSLSSINGGASGGLNTLKGANVKTDWNLTGLGGGANALVAIGNAGGTETKTTYLNSFSNVQNLQGNNAVDTFNINTVFLGEIKGGAGADIFNVNAVAGKLLGETGSDSFLFTSLNNTGSAAEINGGDNATENNILAGRHAANTWEVTDNGEGILKATATGTAYVTKFTNIKTLNGGDLADTFDINSSFKYDIKGGLGLNSYVIRNTAGVLLGGDEDDSYVFSDSATATLVDGGKGKNTLTGRNANNEWTLSAAGNSLAEIDSNGNSTTYIDEFTRIQAIIGGSKNDTFVIDTDFLSTDTLVAGVIIPHTISGGAGDDKFTINARVGQVFGDGGSDTFTFGLNGVAAAVNGGVNTSTTVKDVNTVVGRGKANIWSLTPIDATAPVNTANAGSVADADTKVRYTDFSFIQSLQGNDDQGNSQPNKATDTLEAAQGVSNWKIDNVDAGKIIAADGSELQFSNMKNLMGSRGADNFEVIGSGAISGWIDGGVPVTGDAIVDTLDVKSQANGVVIELGDVRTADLPGSAKYFNARNIELIDAAEAAVEDNVLKGASDKGYTWTIDKNNGGNIVATPAAGDVNSVVAKTAFTHFGVLTGGSNNDRFNVTAANAITTSVDGGDGVDFLDYSKNKAPVVINLAADGRFSLSGINGIEGIVGNNDGKGTVNSTDGTVNDSSISIANADKNIWTLGVLAGADGINDGFIELNGKSVSFENFNIINGGSGTDEFVLLGKGKFLGTINGGGGSNSFDSKTAELDQLIAIKGPAANAASYLNATNLSNISSIQANANTKSTLVSANEVNVWNLAEAAVNSSVVVRDTSTKIDFNGFVTVRGGAQKDRFNILSAEVAILLDGGTGPEPDTDTVSLTDLDAGINVGVGATADALLKLVNIEKIEDKADGNNRLIADDTDHFWLINNKNQGVLDNTLAFQGFSSLKGGKGIDKFSLETKDAALSGSIDGGDGSDSLNIALAGRGLEVYIDRPEVVAEASPNDNALDITGIESLSANKDKDLTSTLIASDTENKWAVTTPDSGELTNVKGKIIFNDFAALIGGNSKDEFIFSDGASISSYIDGKDGNDLVDIHLKLTDANILLGDAGKGYRNIESYIGNDTNSILYGADIANTWTLSALRNQGDVNNIAFAGFATLAGGKENNIFDLTQGLLTGSVLGGEGSNTFTLGAGQVLGQIVGGADKDIFDINITAATAAKNTLVGGTGANVINVSGGDINYTAAHEATGDASGLLTYKNQDNKEFTILYSQMTQINDNLLAASLTLKGSANADEFTLSKNTYSLSPLVVSYTQKTGLVIAGNADDKLTVAGAVDGLQSLVINNVSVASNQGLLDVDQLQLNAVGAVGDLNNRLNIDTRNLSVDSATGDIYLNATGDLILDKLANNTLFDLQLSGDLTGKQLISSGDFNIKSTAGNITLEQDNALSGKISLSALKAISLNNVGATKLGNTQAESLAVRATGDINGGDPLSVSGLASFNSAGNILLTNAANNFNQVNIGSAVDVSIVDKDLLTLTGIKASGLVDTRSVGVEVKGAVTAGGLTLNAGEKAALIDADITAVQMIDVNAAGIVGNSTLTASRIQLDGSSGDVTLSGLLDTSSKETITLKGKDIKLGAKILAGDNVDIQASGALIQSANIDSAKNIMVAAKGDLTMDANTTSTGDFISYTADGVMKLLGTLVATNDIAIKGAKAVTQSGNITSSRGDLAINAGQFTMTGDTSLAAANGSVAVTTTSGSLSARAINAVEGISLTSADTVQLDKDVNASKGAVEILAKKAITLTGNVNADAGVNIKSDSDNIQQNLGITSQQNDIALWAGGNILMSSAAVSEAKNGNIRYTGKNITVNTLIAKNGAVVLDATDGAVTVNVGPVKHVTAKLLDIKAATGIAANGVIKTDVSELSLSSKAGDIHIENGIGVTVTQLRTNGDVDFRNLSGNVVLNNKPVQGGVGSTPEINYQIDQLTLNVQSGSLVSGSPTATIPDITANSAVINVLNGNFGVPARPIIFSGSDFVLLEAARSWGTGWIGAEGVVTNNSLVQSSLSDISSTGHEQLVQLEALEEINPAIFTNVRNYVYDDVAILLPEDQRYDDDESVQ